MDYIKQNHLSILIIVFLVVSAFSGNSKMFGGTAPTSNFTFTPVMQQGHRTAALGTTGTLISKELEGTCNATFSGTSLAATSTGQFFCAVTGVTSGDRVVVVLPAGARTSSNAWFSLVDTYATTTGVIGFDIANWTGTATTSFPLATTSIMYRVTN